MIINFTNVPYPSYSGLASSNTITDADIEKISEDCFYKAIFLFLCSAVGNKLIEFKYLKDMYEKQECCALFMVFGR
jgi:hypothetical protein